MRLGRVHRQHVRSHRVGAGLGEAHRGDGAAEVDSLRSRGRVATALEVVPVPDVQRPAVRDAGRVRLVDRPHLVGAAARRRCRAARAATTAAASTTPRVRSRRPCPPPSKSFWAPLPFSPPLHVRAGDRKPTIPRLSGRTGGRRMAMTFDRRRSKCTDGWSRSKASTRQARGSPGNHPRRILPGLKEIDGFAGFVSLIDEENSRARSVVLWETKESAEEGSAASGRSARRSCGGWAAPCGRRISMKRRLWRCTPEYGRRGDAGLDKGPAFFSLRTAPRDSIRGRRRDVIGSILSQRRRTAERRRRGLPAGRYRAPEALPLLRDRLRSGTGRASSSGSSSRRSTGGTG